jgi:hypothetical protein
MWQVRDCVTFCRHWQKLPLLCRLGRLPTSRLNVVFPRSLSKWRVPLFAFHMFKYTHTHTHTNTFVIPSLARLSFVLFVRSYLCAFDARKSIRKERNEESSFVSCWLCRVEHAASPYPKRDGKQYGQANERCWHIANCV